MEDLPAAEPEPPKPAKAKPKAKKSAAPNESGAASSHAALGNGSQVEPNDGSASKVKEAQSADAGGEKSNGDSLSLPLQVPVATWRTPPVSSYPSRGSCVHAD